MNELPLYDCHKQVRAAKIVFISTPNQHGGQNIGFDEPELDIRSVTPGWVQKHTPQVGGYFVQYKDGYESYSPAEAFEEGYSLACDKFTSNEELHNPWEIYSHKIILPEIVKVAGLDVVIKQFQPYEATNQKMFGSFNSNGLYIEVDTTQNKIKVVDTLLHEINHAIYWAYGFDDEDKEERLVGAFANAWTQVFRDNPSLLAFITESLK